METILSGFISDILGVYTRYYFLKIIGREKSVKYLWGDSDDEANNVSHSFINTFFGLLVFIPIIIGIVKVMYILSVL